MHHFRRHKDTIFMRYRCVFYALSNNYIIFAVSSTVCYMAQHNDLGKWGEDLAANFLIDKGYVIRERDWKCGKRDIDIIALAPDQATVVFVEVKTRTTNELEEPQDAVNRQKVKSIGMATHLYIKQFDVVENVRFDIISVVGTNRSNANIEHIEDAFNPLLY